MIITLKDLIIDYLYFKNKDSYTQSEVKNNIKFNYKCEFKGEIKEFLIEILNISKIIRIGNEKTPYKIHKSYPSARSLYPQKIYVNLEKNKYISINRFTQKLELYYSNIKGKEDSIIIVSDDINFSQYKSIHKSLILLECGHMIYNFYEIANIFGYNINKIIINDNKIVVNLKKYKENTSEYIKAELKKIKNKYMVRNSGPYYGGIYNFKRDNKKICGSNYSEIFKELQYILKVDIFKYLKIIELINNYNDGFVNNKLGINIPYYMFNSEYQYLDFRSSEKYILFLVNKKEILKKSKYITKIVLSIGCICQKILLENTTRYKYNRPLKQILSNDLWDKIKKQSNINLDKYYQFYGLVSGIFEEDI